MIKLVNVIAGIVIKINKRLQITETSRWLHKNIFYH